MFIISVFFLTGSGSLTMSAQNEPTPAKAFFISNAVTESVSKGLIAKYGESKQDLIRKGVQHVSELWQKQDGTEQEFEVFCTENFIASDEERKSMFEKIANYWEATQGHFNKMKLLLQEPTHLDSGKLLPVDQLFAGYEAGAHLYSDLYTNKIAFIIALNFPYYSLEEKSSLGTSWTPLQWGYARMGDLFTARVPSELDLKYAEINSNADLYIAEYNIFMGTLLNDKGEKLFPKDMKLLSHWNLRDEIKSNYNLPRGLEKQRMVYEVMKRIVSQDIPKIVINNSEYDWNPIQNKVFKDGKPVEFQPELNTRYQHIWNTFQVEKAIDAYYPSAMNTFIKRKFDVEMEISQPEVEALFTRFVSSPQVKKVAALIKKRLKRNLEPFDIWYNGFTPKSNISEEKLDEMTKTRYPNPKAFENDLPTILTKLGFSKEKVDFLSARVVVDPARGSGHAWGPVMKSEVAHLRTRIPPTGMNYKGYNIAVHEFGHNVEQLISLNDVNNYMISGIPNTSFTEALAFVFQKRDLELLGIKENNPDKEHLLALETFWNVYEIMGVSLLDMSIWKWLYNNPNATVDEFKKSVIQISKDIWNKYYAGILGPKDQTLLAIYSHMLPYPLYLSAYSYGHVIDFQFEQHFKGKNMTEEIEKMFSQGRLTPQIWMKKATGNEISIDALLNATDEALKKIIK